MLFQVNQFRQCPDLHTTSVHPARIHTLVVEYAVLLLCVSDCYERAGAF